MLFWVIGAENALLFDGGLELVLVLPFVLVVWFVIADMGVSAREIGVVDCCFDWFLLDFFSFFGVGVGVGVGVAGGGGGSAGVGGSSTMSFPLRFLPCRRHGCNGVARTRTSHGNLWKRVNVISFYSAVLSSRPGFGDRKKFGVFQSYRESSNFLNKTGLYNSFSKQQQ